MKRSYIILIIGSCLVIAGFSFSAISTQMLYNIPTEPPTMRPITGFDYVVITAGHIFPIIVFSGIIILVIGVAIFFIQEKNLRC